MPGVSRPIFDSDPSRRHIAEAAARAARADLKGRVRRMAERGAGRGALAMSHRAVIDVARWTLYFSPPRSDCRRRARRAGCVAAARCCCIPVSRPRGLTQIHPCQPISHLVLFDLIILAESAATGGAGRWLRLGGARIYSAISPPKSAVARRRCITAEQSSRFILAYLAHT